MKRSARNLLWQQKRDSLPIDQDQQSDWAELQKMLDATMPVSNNNTAGELSAIKTALRHIARFKFIYVMIALLATGVIVYFSDKRDSASRTDKNHYPKIKKGNINSAIDSVADNSKLIDSVTDNNAAQTASSETHKISEDNKSAAVNLKNDKNDLSAANNNKEAKAVSTGINKINRKAVDDIKSNPHSVGINNQSASHRHNHLNNRKIVFNNSTSSIVNQLNRIDNMRKTRVSGLRTGGPATGLLAYTQQATNDIIAPIWPSKLFNWDADALLEENADKNVINKLIFDKATTRAFSLSNTKEKNGWQLPIEWGILAGINAPGSFTAADNHNTNGVPFDAYTGLFASYNLNDKWAINLQVRAPSPHKVSGNYSYTEEGKTDSVKHTVTSKITDSRKMYMIDIPLHLTYKLNPNVGIKAGPVISIPLIQANGLSKVITTGIPKDSVTYFSKIAEALNNTTIEQKIRYGVSGGVNFNYKRFILEATYYHGFQTQKVNSDLGTYTSNNNTLQIAIGFRLNKKH